MIKKIREMSFTIVVIFLVAIGIYWIMEQLQKDYMDQYINILGEKLMSMVPEASEKEELRSSFNQFKTKFEENEIPPEEVERIVAKVYNLYNFNDSLSFAEANALIRVPEVQVIPDLPRDDNRWRDLEQKLSNVYRFDQKNQMDRDAKIKFQVDKDLNILVDDSIKNALNEGRYEHLIIEMEHLEKNRAVIWVNSLDSNLMVVEDRLIKIREKHGLLEEEKFREMEQIIAVTVDSIHTAISIRMDSLNYIHRYHTPEDKKVKQRE